MRGRHILFGCSDEEANIGESGSGTGSEAEARVVDAGVAELGSGTLHFTVAERAARGRAARSEIPRRAHAPFEPAPLRRDPVGLLEEQAQHRLPELVPIRYGRMLVSPFTFFRGAAYLMAADLADGPRTGLQAQLCGDAHLSNFGIFAAPDRRLVFSINDFDETLPGPFEWDVKRLAASFAVAGRDRGFDAATDGSVVMAAMREYRQAMARFAEMRNIDVWYARLDVDGHPRPVRVRDVRQADEALPVQRRHVRTKDSMRALAKLCRTVDGELRIVGNPPLVTPIEDVLPGAEQEHLEDVVRRMIGTYQRTPAARPAPSARELPVRPRGPQGRRRRQRRRPHLDPALRRPRRRRSAVPPVQGGAGVGARAVPRQEPVRASTGSASSRGSG